MELLQTEPVPVFIDGAHNVAGVQSAVDTLLELFPDDELRGNEPLKFGAVPKRFKRFNFVFGVLKDKEWREMYLIIARVAKSIQLVTPSSDRALPARELAALIGMPPQSESLTMEEGLADTIADSRRGDVVCVLGSLYLQK
jgi:dihydrofolate synthase/folylpolyglutamate synthase